MAAVGLLGTEFRTVFLIATGTKETEALYPAESKNDRGDSGVDVLFPKDVTVAAGKNVDIHFDIRVRALQGSQIVSWLLLPRSSFGKTPLICATPIPSFNIAFGGSDGFDDEESQLVVTVAN